MMVLNAAAIKEKAHDLGFNLVGITRAHPSPFLDAYERWVDAGMHGSMGYMARPDRLARRRDLSVILPGVQTLVVVGYDYSADAPQDVLRDPSRGRIAAYAWGVDYHDVMLPKLEALAGWIASENEVSAGAQYIAPLQLPKHAHRAYVDTGALLERGHAYAAGLGFVGKNTMLIHPRRGSYFFLGELLLTEECDAYDTPGRATMCGSCTRCLNACPTDAFPQPHVLDARRCISYLTIEHKGWIDRALRPLMGNWVYGCDVCQEVCPFQRFANKQSSDDGIPSAGDPRGAIYCAPTDPVGDISADESRLASTDNLSLSNTRIAPSLLDLLALTAERFTAHYVGTPIARIGRERLVRNACVAAGNWGSTDALAPLLALLDDASPLVRGHAAWALGRIGGAEAQAALARRLRREEDAEVHEEIKMAIADI
jgi:epoxyqueuosine reductase